MPKLDLTYMNKNYRHDREFRDYQNFAVGSVMHNKTTSAPTNMKNRTLLKYILYGMVH
jgi:opine dehydrogenase